MRLILLVVCLSLFQSCNAENSESNAIKQNMTKIELYFFPSDLEKDIRYSILIEGNTVSAKNHHRLGTKSLIEGFKKELSKEQIDTLNKLIAKQEVNKVKPHMVTEDTWGAKLIVDDRVMYESSQFSLKHMDDNTRNLIEYLFSLLPVKIELYGFS